jgi:MinD-like ATPase involved in chromosome partitioning or flagellar assembly
MPVYLLQESGAHQSTIEAGLRAAVPDLIEATSLDAIRAAGVRADGDQRAIVLVIMPPGDHAYFNRLVDFCGQNNELFLILIGDEILASDYKRLLRTGGADWASAKVGPGEVTDIIARRRALESDFNSAAARPSGNYPVTISFVPSAGGVGNTTLAVEAAIRLKENKSTRHRKICLVDLDFQTSHVCDYLDGEPRLQIAELSSAPERLDERLFESFRTRHSSEIDVFAAPRSKYLSEDVNINALDALFNMIARRYDLVFIDYPVTWFQWTPQIIAASDGAIITGINTIPCLRQVSETLANVRSSGSPALQLAVAINRRKHAQMVLSDERVFFVATRPEAIESVNMGAPMMLNVAKKSRKDFDALANFCAELRSRRWGSA